MGGFNTENWTIVLARNEKTILQPLVEFQKTLALLFVLVFAFVLLLSAAGIRQSMEPLAKLREGYPPARRTGLQRPCAHFEWRRVRGVGRIFQQHGWEGRNSG